MSTTVGHSEASHGNSVGCQSGGSHQSAVTYPWSDSEYVGKKTTLYKYVLRGSDGVPLPKVVSDVFGDDLRSGGSEYQLARRFFKRYPEYFKTDRRGGLLWVEPRLGLFNLRQQYAKRKKARQRRGGLSNDTNTDLERGDGIEDSPRYSKDRAQAVLDKYLQFTSDTVRQSFLKALVTELDSIQDKYNIFKRVRGQGSEYLCVPYTNRFNDAGRAGDIQQGFNFALETATERHSNAVVLTVTTDPQQHEGLSDALESLSENKARLMSWLAYQVAPGQERETPENLSVLEFSRSGLPHYHIVLFGVSWAVSQQQLSAKWQSYGQGRIVDVRTAETVHDGDTWLLHDDGQGRVSLEHYLGKAIRGLQTVAQSDVKGLKDRVERGDVSLWRQALYWATERQYYTCSPTLKEPTESDDLPHITEWQFVGTAEYGNIPAHVRDSAILVDRPPPG